MIQNLTLRVLPRPVSFIHPFSWRRARFSGGDKLPSRQVICQFFSAAEFDTPRGEIRERLVTSSSMFVRGGTWIMFCPNFDLDKKAASVSVLHEFCTDLSLPRQPSTHMFLLMCRAHSQHAHCDLQGRARRFLGSPLLIRQLAGISYWRCVLGVTAN